MAADYRAKSTLLLLALEPGLTWKQFNSYSAPVAS